MLFGLFEKMGQFIYRPNTYWGRLLSPTFNFGCNVDDEPIEAHVRSQVGSYGKQLNRLMDALSVLVQHARLDVEELPEQDRKALASFLELDAKADEAARSYSRGDTLRRARDLVREIEVLRRSPDAADARTYRAIASALSEALATDQRPQPA